MRILSQDIPMINVFDVPYETAMLSMSKYMEGRYRIYVQGTFIGNTSDDNFVLMAEYSTAEKAQKTMEMLRKAYSPLLIIKDLGNGIEADIKPNDWIVNRTEPNGIRENFYFQFPADDEVEV